jgi:hypothetical protein
VKQLPRELAAFEIEAFFSFTLAERQPIEDRRRPGLMLGLAPQMGFRRMRGRLLDNAETRHRYGYPAFEESQSVGIGTLTPGDTFAGHPSSTSNLLRRSS